MEFNFTEIKNKKESNKKLWSYELIKVCNAWIEDIKKRPSDFRGCNISDIDQMIAWEVSRNLGFTETEYEIMSTDRDYDLAFEGFKKLIEMLL